MAYGKKHQEYRRIKKYIVFNTPTLVQTIKDKFTPQISKRDGFFKGTPHIADFGDL